MTSENLPFYELTDAELCWLLNDNAVENINSNSDFSEFIKASKAKVINDEMRFKYVTEDQFNSCIGSNDNNIELSVFHMNIRILNSKHKLLCQFLDLLHLSFDVIILSEIWSNNIVSYRLHFLLRSPTYI